MKPLRTFALLVIIVAALGACSSGNSGPKMGTIVPLPVTTTTPSSTTTSISVPPTPTSTTVSPSTATTTSAPAPNLQSVENFLSSKTSDIGLGTITWTYVAGADFAQAKTKDQFCSFNVDDSNAPPAVDDIRIYCGTHAGQSVSIDQTSEWVLLITDASTEYIGHDGTSWFGDELASVSTNASGTAQGNKTFGTTGFNVLIGNGIVDGEITLNNT